MKWLLKKLAGFIHFCAAETHTRPEKFNLETYVTFRRIEARSFGIGEEGLNIIWVQTVNLYDKSQNKTRLSWGLYGSGVDNEIQSISPMTNQLEYSLSQ